MAEDTLLLHDWGKWWWNSKPDKRHADQKKHGQFKFKARELSPPSVLPQPADPSWAVQKDISCSSSVNTSLCSDHDLQDSWRADVFVKYNFFSSSSYYSTKTTRASSRGRGTAQARLFSTGAWGTGDGQFSPQRRESTRVWGRHLWRRLSHRGWARTQVNGQHGLRHCCSGGRRSPIKRVPWFRVVFPVSTYNETADEENRTCVSLLVCIATCSQLNTLHTL